MARLRLVATDVTSPSTALALRAGEIARGDYWSIVREGPDYILCHVSAGLRGREERLVIEEREARDILAGRIAVVHFLPRTD